MGESLIVRVDNSVVSHDSILVMRARLAESTTYTAARCDGGFGGVEKLNRQPQLDWGSPISGDDLALIKNVTAR